MCHKAGDPNFQNLTIDLDIMRRCKENAMMTHTPSGETSLASSPEMPFPYTQLPIWPPRKSLRPKPVKANDVESGYGTDTDRSDIYTSCPVSPNSNGWTPVNKPRALNLENFRFPTTRQDITSTPRGKTSPLDTSASRISKRPASADKTSDNETSPSSRSVQGPAPKKRKMALPTTTSRSTPELGAAYTLMQMSMADTKQAKGERGFTRRRASA